MDDSEINVPPIVKKAWRGLGSVLWVLLCVTCGGYFLLEGAVNIFFGAALQEIVSIDKAFSVKVPYSWASDVALARNYAEYTLWASDKRLPNVVLGKSEQHRSSALQDHLTEQYRKFASDLWPGSNVISTKTLQIAGLPGGHITVQGTRHDVPFFGRVVWCSSADKVYCLVLFRPVDGDEPGSRVWDDIVASLRVNP